MILSYLKLDIRTTFRQKTYLLLSIALPLIFFLVFTSIGNVPKEQAQTIYKESLFSMAVFSLTSFCLMTFPIELINDKQSGWQKKILSTSMKAHQYYLAKILKIMGLFALSISLIFIAAATLRGVKMTLEEWLFAGLLLWVGSSLFLSVGVLLSQIPDIKKASSIGNLLYLLLAIAGGLWFPIKLFPNWLQTIAHWTPTYHLKNVVFSYTTTHSISWYSFGVLFIYSILFLIIAFYIQQKTDVI
ncbi:ABC transporter permease [Staphylococcus piscifermentans]|uniref:Transport permease protein n=1 Tax=Staphylococcus piscifermentans TaxID=70258 RepID=A0A239TQE7_9STAP|nr:ABC transporter permease [Staphylococcus piscifermentans]RTX82556.1 ABC transporter permease [Staphylococcus piscifermentans]GEP84564.1 transport permease protein [Staphylococcus piscifermentans]SNV00181.1 ABC transporter permease [Staphylococcus piscifermentans]